MRVKKVDALYAVETPNDTLFTPNDPEIHDQVRIGEKLLEKHCEIFEALAK